MLFARLPDTIFKPLAGPNRAVYQEVLLKLHSVFFDDESPDLFPSREMVQREVEETLGRMARLEWAKEEDDDPEEQEDTVTGVAPLAARVLRRLMRTGWLDEEREGYDRPRLVMPPAVNFLLRTLMEISRQEKKNYGGTVLSILNNLEAALDKPVERAIGIQEAVRVARDFNEHLTAMIYGLRELQAQISSTREPRAILASFFDDFVAEILVADYKTLKTKNNPFRFRRQILSLLHDLRQDRDRLSQLVSGYVEQFGIGEEAAKKRLDDHLQLIERVFETVEARLAKIDQFRYRLEQRVADTVRYMDRTIPGAKARFVALLMRVGEAADRRPEALEEIPFPDTFARPLPISPQSIKVAGRQRRPPEPQILHLLEVDQLYIDRARELREYETRRRITPRLIHDYIERNLAGRDSLAAADFEIRSVEDYIAFSFLRRLTSLGPRGRQLIGSYAITFDGSTIKNRWTECRGFTVSRKTG